MLDFARSALLGPIHCGLPREELRKLLGEPPDWACPANSASQARIWRYGDVEFCFGDDLKDVLMIYSDHEDLTSGGGTLHLDPWVIRRGLGRSQLEDALARMGVDFAVERPAYDTRQRLLVTAANVTFNFMEEPEEPGEPCGLFAWAARVPSYESPGQRARGL